MTAAVRDDGSVQGLETVLRLLARGCHWCVNANVATFLFCILGYQEGELFHTRWKKSCRTKSGIHGNGGNARGNGKKEISLHFWSNWIAKTVSPGITNVVMPKKCLPTFPGSREVPGPLMLTLRGRQAQGMTADSL